MKYLFQILKANSIIRNKIKITLKQIKYKILLEKDTNAHNFQARIKINKGGNSLNVKDK